MTPLWDDLNARARGLSGRLLGRDRLQRLTEVGDLAAFASELERAGYGPVPPSGEISPAAIERALRRGAARHLGILARWCGRRALTLAVIFEDEDRRSLRALLRGAVAGVPAEARLRGLIPTPTLPHAALQELARQAMPSALASLLAVWGNPYGSVLLAESQRAQPDLFGMEILVNRRFAERAVGAARGGGRALRTYVRRTIDLENACAALVIASRGKDVAPADCHLPGGRRVTCGLFVAAVSSGDPLVAAAILAAALRGLPYAAILRRHARDTAALEAALLAARVREQGSAARREPLGPSPLLTYALRLRAEVIDLRRILWGLALGAPRGVLSTGLVTAS